jgi:hypothetical protein
MSTLFKIGRYYTRDEIAEALGGAKQWYLPTVKRRVVAVCLRKEHNPKAPNVVLCGFGKRVEKTGEWLASETLSLPVFVKDEINRWQYHGRYKVISSSTSGPKFLREIGGKSKSGFVSRVVYLERAYK